MSCVDSISQADAQKAVTELKAGRPPGRYLADMTVGRAEEIAYFQQKFADVASFGLSDIKFVTADYGGGKTHFLDLLAQMGLDRNFVVSKVDLDSRRCRFDHFEEVYASLVRGITTKDYPDGGALDGLLDAWAASVRDMDDLAIHADLRSILTLPVTMRAALFEYAKASRDHVATAITLHDDLMSWLIGERLGTRQRNALRVSSQIGPASAAEMLRGLLGFIRAQGYTGFLVLLDEAEAITSLQRLTARAAANENIRSIIDNAGKSPGFYFVFATTPSFMDPNEPRGAATYQALWRRIRNPLAGSTALERVIIELRELTLAEFEDLAVRVNHLVTRGVPDGNPVSDEEIQQLARYVHDQGGKSPSTLVRSVVLLRAQAAADPHFDFASTYPFVVQEQIQEAAQEQL